MAKEKKPHLCKTCGETDPENFYVNSKGICKKCYLKNKANHRSKPDIKVERAKYNKEYYIKRRINPEVKAIKAKYDSEYKRSKLQTDTVYRFMNSLRTRQRRVLKGKASTTEGLGCSSQELIEWLSSQFTEGMTLENHGCGEGCWHMDHIIPLSSYEEDAQGNWCIYSEYNKKLIHYTNLQPMWHTPNLEKSDSINENDLQEFLERVI
jgi:hypothetical protein